MLRIDENTYIDDSLVTCAEYQLFIDEMCAQGQFFQPDHWTSWQFPAGQAHAPILGVRPSDAKAFCEWLSGREEGEWRYRLPTANEATGYPIQKQEKQLSGFWMLDGNEHHFAWIGPAPVDPRGIDFSHLFALNLKLDRVIEVDRALDLDRTRDRSIAISMDLGVILGLCLDLGIILGRDIDRDIGHVLDDDIDHVLDRAIDRAINLALNLAHGTDIDIGRARDIDRDRNHIPSIWIDLITLQERIAGRSPAFEGIRLVKERKAE